MPYKDPLTADTVLVRGAIQSPNYVAGVSGWIVRQNGSAEFQNLIARGTIVADQIKTSNVQTDPRIWINNPADDPNSILFYTPSQNDATPIRELGKILGNPFGGTNPSVTIRAWGTDSSDVEDTEILVSGHPLGFIQLTAEDQVFVFAPGTDGTDGFKYNTFTVVTANEIRRYSSRLSANVALAAAGYTTLGMQIAFNTERPNAEVEVTATFDTNVTVAGAAGDLATYQVLLDGAVVPAANQTPYADTRTVHRELVPGVWALDVPAAGAHTIDFQGRKNAGSVATVTATTSVSAASAVVLDNNGGT